MVLTLRCPACQDATDASLLTASDLQSLGKHTSASSWTMQEALKHLAGFAQDASPDLAQLQVYAKPVPAKVLQ